MFWVPTFFVGEAMYFNKDRLDQVAVAIKGMGETGDRPLSRALTPSICHVLVCFHVTLVLLFP